MSPLNQYRSLLFALFLAGCAGASSDKTAPAISHIDAAEIDSAAATVTWETDKEADTQVQYGATASYGLSTALAAARVKAHQQPLSGLQPGTLYHYQVLSRDAAGHLVTSPDQTFSTPAAASTPSPATITPPTLVPVAARTASPGPVSVRPAKPAPPDTTPPLISGITAVGIGSGEAAIRWKTDEPAGTEMEYGTTTQYEGATWTASPLITAHAANLTGLLPSTLYHYRVKGRDAAGNLAVSPDATFTTLGLPDSAPPSLPTGVTAAAVSYSQINVAWNASTDNIGVTGYRLYRNGTPVATSSGQIYSDGNLAPDTTYRYTVAAYDAAGNLSAPSMAISVHTPPFLSGIVSGKITEAGSTISWTTVEPATTQVEYGTTAEYGSFSDLETSPVTLHSVALTGLTPSTTYHFHAISRDAAGNVVLSPDQILTTPAPPAAITAAPTALTATAASLTQ
ncbi:MAG: hypothetical protein HY282_12815 [Nitrospirae bacterium]|nr:hypothetical protein [Candidatus Manganitrophaceae bacterium]